MNLRTILIDDEPSCIQLLTDHLNNPELNVTIAGIAHSSEEGWRKIDHEQPDIVFLDVEMPGETGLEMLNRYASRNFDVVIVSAHEQFALDAYRHQAFTYLLKPFSADEVSETIARIRQKRSGEEALQKQEAQSTTAPLKQEGRLPINTQEGTHILVIEEIIRCEADGSYTEIFLQGGTKLTASLPIKYFEAQLSNSGFLRVHKSHLVNLNEIAFIDHSGCIHLRNQDHIQVAMRKRKRLLQQLISL